MTPGPAGFGEAQARRDTAAEDDLSERSAACPATD
jgi:hypothetical protein